MSHDLSNISRKDFHPSIHSPLSRPGYSPPEDSETGWTGKLKSEFRFVNIYGILRNFVVLVFFLLYKCIFLWILEFFLNLFFDFFCD